MLNFEIGPLYIELVENEISCLEDLAGHKLTPGYLFQELQKCGINLLPNASDAKLAGIEAKDWGAEYRAIVDVACSVRAFHY